MSQPSHLYLPKLSSDADVASPDREGAWKDNDRKVLRDISRGIVVSQRAKDVHGVSSVPDIWARPLTFQSALQPESGHPLRDQMVKEWRGLMSLLALRRVQNHDVEIVPITLDQGAFSSALRNLKPADVQLEPDRRYSWTDVLMIRYEDIPVGAFSPTTLVYTAVDYQEELRGHPLNLQQLGSDGRKTGLLGPPTTPQEKKYVGEWVYRLRQRLGSLLNLEGEGQRGASVSNNINELLSSWLEDIRDDLNHGSDAIDAPDVKVRDNHTALPKRWPPLDDYRIYQELLRPLEFDEDARSEGGNSDLALDPARNRSDYEEVVVLTPPLMEQNAKIWKITRLDQLGGDAHEALKRDFDKPQGDHIGGADLSKYNSCWVRPERYFLTDTLLEAPGSEPIIPDTERALNGEEGRFLLPFKKEILDFFSPREIQEQLAPEFEVEDTGEGITFSFSLPLVGGRAADVEKTYRPDNPHATEGRIVDVSMPVLELFPDYLGENWRRYYLFQGHVGSVTATPILYGDSATSVRERSAHVEGERRTVRTTEMRGDEAFPEAIDFRGNAGGAPHGLLLIDRDMSETNRLTGPDHRRVGIDFGTSNITIFRSDDGNAQKWSFAFSRYLRGLTSSDDPARDELLERYFLPDDSIDLPVPSFLRVLRGRDNEKLLLDYFAFFGSSYRVPDFVETNVKWEGDADLIYKFVESLLFLVLLETTDREVNELELAASYPEAFSEDIEGMFRQAWQEKISALTDGQDRVLSVSQGPEDRNTKLRISGEGASFGGDVTFEKEGHAAGEYFGSEEILALTEAAEKEGAAVCLDVGGGTTDISVWYDGDIVHSASVLLAGNDIAEYLKEDPQLRELLFSKDAAVALQEGASEPGYRFASRLNSVLRREGQDVQRLIAKHGNKGKVRQLRQAITLQFGALSYYTAALLGATEQMPEGRGIADWISNSDNDLKLHWGGNGAKLLSWVDHGAEFRRDGVAAKVLRAIAFNALRRLDHLELDASRLSHVMSPEHKSEAAGGLSVMQLDKYASGDGPPNDEMVYQGIEAQDSSEEGESGVSDDDTASSDDGVVCGETVRLTGGPVDFTGTISNDGLFENGETTYENTDLEHLTRFVEMINHFGTNFGLFSESMKIELNDGRKRTIDSKVEKEFKRARDQPEEERVLEPVFITEVKALLELIRSG